MNVLNFFSSFLKWKMLILFSLLFLYPLQESDASSLSYGYNFLTSNDKMEGHQQLTISDGYCIFSYNFFDRICFEMSGSIRFTKLKFDLSPQVVFHLLYLQQPIYGWHLTVGNVFTLSPQFQIGAKVAVGFYLYFVSLSLEYQALIGHQGDYEGRLFVQIGLVIPTGSMNFFLGTQGL